MIEILLLRVRPAGREAMETARNVRELLTDSTMLIEEDFACINSAIVFHADTWRMVSVHQPGMFVVQKLTHRDEISCRTIRELCCTVVLNVRNIPHEIESVTCPLAHDKFLIDIYI
jgi:hypothetical protein